jgi:nitrogen fixation NifU-like protein
MAYNEKVITHFENPQNVGSLDKTNNNVGTGLVGSPECGDVVKLQLCIDPVSKIITDVKFKAFGCGSAIASSSLLTELVKGKTIADALLVKNTDIIQELSLPPIKIHCSVLAESALRSAINDFLDKQSKIEVKK